MRLIDADELLLLYEGVDESLKVSLRVVKQNIKDAPTIEAEPRKHENRRVVNIRSYHGTLYAPTKHGRWEPYTDKDGKAVIGKARCSVCGGWYEHILWVSSELNYCPNCGADMRPKEEVHYIPVPEWLKGGAEE